MPDLAQMFAEKPDFKLSQYNRLSENSNEWQEEIFKLLHEKVPQKLGLRVKIVFQKVDEEKGYAVGSAVMQDPESKKQVNVPIIIRAFHLAPLDVMISGDKALPFTPENIKETLFNAAVFTTTAPERKREDMFDDNSMFTQTNPPMSGKYMYSADYKVMNAISGTLGADDIAAFREHLDADPGVLRALIKNGAAEVINGITTEPAAKEKAFAKAVKTIFTIKKDSPNRYCIYANSDSVFDPMRITASRAEATDLLLRLSGYSDTVGSINDVDKNGERTVKLPPKPYEKAPTGPVGLLGKPGVPFLYDAKADGGIVGQLDKFERVGVRDRAGVFARGVLIPNIVTFDGKKTGLKIFLSHAISALQQRIAGVALKESNDQPSGSARLPFGEPAVGKMGCFAYETETGAVATVPVAVKSVTIYAGATGIRCITYDGKPVNLVFAPGVHAIGKTQAMPILGPLTSPSEDNYYVPDTFRFVEMRNLRRVAEDREEFVKQANASVLDARPLRIIAINDGYVFRGPSEKYAEHFDMQALPPHEAKFLLASWGATAPQASEFLKAAHVLVRTEVHGLTYPPLPGEAYAGMRKQASVLDGLIGEIKSHAWPLLKAAAGIHDSETIDKSLAIGFVTPTNVKKFVGVIPQYREVISSLAKLLLASRMGMEDLPEENISSAMGDMQQIVRGLEKLKLLDQSDEAPRG